VDKEKLVFGNKRTTVLYKDAKKQGAVTIRINK